MGFPASRTRLLRDRCACGADLVSRVDRGEGPKVIRCRACGLLSLSAFPPDDEVRAWYRDCYWSAYGGEKTGSGRTEIHAHATGWLESCLAGRGTLVDVGCGGGSLLGMARERGWAAIGFDPSTEAVAQARSLGLEAYQLSWPPCPLEDESAEAITFINVLDHMTDPASALAEAFRVLRPGGWLYVRVPNGPWHVPLMGILSRLGLGNVPVVHLHAFGRRSIILHLRRAGFEVLSVRTSPPAGGAADHAPGWMRSLMVADRGFYRVLERIHLDERAWGFSIEAMAVKPVSPGRATMEER